MTLTDVEVNPSTPEDFLDSETLVQVDLMQQKIQQYLQTLSVENLKMILEFAAYLSDKESEKATQEMETVKSMSDRITAFQKGEESKRKRVSKKYNDKLMEVGEKFKSFLDNW